MGGHKAGDYASRYTTQRIVASVSRNPGDEPVTILKEAIETANKLLITESAEDESKRGMGTTLVAATVIGRHLVVANIGDSRLYIINRDIRQITRDHSLVAEMVRIGEVPVSEARKHPDKNIITRAIGAGDDVDADFFEVDLNEGDRILICTDGLTNMVEDQDIRDIVLQNIPLEERVELLVRTANRNGGKDNITVMMIE